MYEKMKVLMIGPGRKVKGGISTVVNNYYTCGLDNAVDLYYLSTMEDGSKAKKLLVAARAYAAINKLLINCDVVHVHMAAQASFDRKAIFIKKAKKAGKKIIIHQHAADFDKYFLEQVDHIKQEKIKYIFSMADKVIVLSDEWADFFGTYVCEKCKVEVLYNGVVMPEYEKMDYSDHNVLMLGRLGKRKGTYDLLKAMPIVIKAVPDATLYLGGDGDVEQCKRIVSSLGLDERVKFLGWVWGKDKEEYLKKCSIFILPSYNEGMPMAVLEAMSYGLATVSTNAGGIPQIIEQGMSGIRVDAGDYMEIAEQLISLLKSAEKRERLGKAGYKHIKSKFDFHVNTNRLIQIYGEVLKNESDGFIPNSKHPL